ncbi:MAG: GNAT family N-acetyltransferase [Candidatus Helarchaeota archaeon]|nr:GNAT family N-acetyltransferase [Candidatus Helarchaeota archaeon]
MQSRVTYLYYIMTLDLKSLKIPEISSKVKIRNVDKNRERENFIELFNRSFTYSKNPFIPLTLDEFDEIPAEDVFVAENKKGKLVGFIIVNIEEREEEKIGLISQIGVHPSFRKSGVAIALAVHGGLYLKDKGIKKWICEVYSENHSAVNFIKKFGFKIEKEVVVVGSEIRNIKPFYSDITFIERLGG